MPSLIDQIKAKTKAPVLQVEVETEFGFHKLRDGLSVVLEDDATDESIVATVLRLKPSLVLYGVIEIDDRDVGTCLSLSVGRDVLNFAHYTDKEAKLDTVLEYLNAAEGADDVRLFDPSKRQEIIEACAQAGSYLMASNNKDRAASIEATLATLDFERDRDDDAEIAESIEGDVKECFTNIVLPMQAKILKREGYSPAQAAKKLRVSVKRVEFMLALD